jgi:hypothetical protein
MAPSLVFLFGIIPAIFLGFGIYMMKKKNQDFSSIDTAVKNFKDIKQIKIIFISKGRAPNGLWGCTVEILTPNNNHKSYPPKEEESIAEFKLEDGRAYPHILLLQQLDSLAARVFTPDDDIKLTHASLGEGIITNIEAPNDAKALLTVKYKMETCKHTSDIFSSSNISTITPVSMKASAINKYIDLLPNSKPHMKSKSENIILHSAALAMIHVMDYLNQKYLTLCIQNMIRMNLTNTMKV